MSTTIVAEGLPFEDNIIHRSRHVSFTSGSITDNDWWFGARDLSGADWRMTLCDAPGGTPQITLTKQADGSTQGLWVTYDANWISPDGIKMGGTRIRPRIDEAAFEVLTFAGTPPAPLVLSYDLLVTPVGEAQQPFCFGTFTVHPGEGD